MSTFLSTTAISKLHGLVAKPLVFDFLISQDYLFYKDRRYHLTDKGKQYGHLHDSGSGSWVVWDQDKFFAILNTFRLSLQEASTLSNDFREDNLDELAAAYGLITAPDVYNLLVDEGYIYYECENKEHMDLYQLTNKGRQHCSVISNNDSDQLVWEESHISDVLSRLKLQLIQDSNKYFKLYHMTHIDNLSNIMAQGLFSHNSIASYNDISNSEVNRRREAEEPVFNRPIHDYVPLYFNVRNAMLYTVQLDYKDRVIILELNPTVCLLKNVIFTYKNAACSSALFYQYVQEFIADNRWPAINQSSWSSAIDVADVRQSMMSECLVLDHIKTSYIRAVHCMNLTVGQEALSIVNAVDNNDVETVFTNSGLFFASHQ